MKNHSRVRLIRERVLEAFLKALESLRGSIEEGKIRPRGAALKAHEIYCAALPPEENRPSWFGFRRLVSGRKADPEILALLESHRITKRGRTEIDRPRALLSFEKALSELGQDARPLNLAERAHEIYAGLSESGAAPSVFSFQRLVYARAADASVQEVKDLLKKAGIKKRARLDRDRLLTSFRKAVEEFYAIPGPSGPMALADRAHAHYVRDLISGAHPSRRTFRHLVSGKTADPEVKEVVNEKLKEPL